MTGVDTAQTTNLKPSEVFSQLKDQFPHVKLQIDDTYYWDAGSEILHHKNIRGRRQVHSFTHELGHAVNRHQQFYFDADLLRLEREAWQWAKTVLNDIQQDYFCDDIAAEHLSGYTDWLLDRAICRRCTEVCPQDDRRIYRCENCLRAWSFPLGRLSTTDITVLR